MLNQLNERVPELRGDLVTLREVAAADVSTLFTLFSDPAVTAYMAPPPPTLAKFLGFVVWSHHQREEGRGFCFGIVPEGMTAAVGILQLRSLDSSASVAEWGFVLSTYFWSTGLFFDAANLFAEFSFTALQLGRLEARIALRNQRAQAAVRRLGARHETTIESTSPDGVPRDPEMVWMLSERDWRKAQPAQSRESAADVRERIRNAVEAAQGELRRSESPETVEPYPLFLFDRRRRNEFTP
jgi:ribosomal-protein-alanine N-acetyltransferase